MKPIKPIEAGSRKTLTVLAAIPSIDCIFDQVNNALQPHLGPLGILQAIRLSLLVFFAYVIVKTLRRSPARAAFIPIPALLALLVLTVAASKELVVRGGLASESIGAYGQMFYWIALWTTVSIRCETAEESRYILRGLALGAFLTALSVIVGLFAGVGNYYTMDSVLSSAGWFDTAKMITGILVVGGVILLYLGERSHPWMSSFAAGLCAIACVLTYARAGQAALVAAMAWLAFWRLFIGYAKEGRWLNRWFALVLVGCMVVPFVVNVNSMLARWGDVGSSDKAGSGRATFWKIAVDAFESEDDTQQSLGIGYKAMSEMLFRDYGEDIKHTHNDFLDLMLVGGIPGILLFASFVLTFLWMALRSGPRSATGGAAIAVFIAYICHSQLTGQIWGTDSMTYYTVTLACLSNIAQRKKIKEPVLITSFSRYQPLPQN
jgi:O-antigen ligase